MSLRFNGVFYCFVLICLNSVLFEPRFRLDQYNLPCSQDPSVALHDPELHVLLDSPTDVYPELQFSVTVIPS